MLRAEFYPNSFANLRALFPCCRSLCPLSQSRNRPASSHCMNAQFRQGPFPRPDALDRLVLLMMRERRLTAELHAIRHGARAAFAVRARISSRSNSASRRARSASAARARSWCRPMCRRAIGIPAGPSTVASVFKRSRVDRARRSRRVTISTSSLPSASRRGAAGRGRVLAPLAVSRKTFLGSGARAAASPARQRSGRRSIPVHSQKSWKNFALYYATEKPFSIKGLF